MKKLVSIILALAMILALSTTAFAAENTIADRAQPLMITTHTDPPFTRPAMLR